MRFIKRHLLLQSLLLAFVGFAAAEDDVPAVNTIAPELQSRIQFINPEYLVYRPAEDTGAKLPLLIFLHGAGGVGNDVHQIKGKPTEIWQGIQNFIRKPCLIVAPQCLRQDKDEARGIWTPEDLNLLLQHLKATLPVDEQRIYLSGISMGGYGTWAWAAHDPQLFAGVAPIAGGIGRGGPKDVTDDFDQWAANLTKVPVYAFVGAQDKTVPPDRSERMVAAIKKAGGKEARLKIYPDEGHGVGRVVVNDAEYYEWLFSQKKR